MVTFHGVFNPFGTTHVLLRQLNFFTESKQFLKSPFNKSLKKTKDLLVSWIKGSENELEELHWGKRPTCG